MVGVLSVAQPVEIYSQSQRAALSGAADAYFDGLIGVVSKSGSDYLAFGPDGDGNTIKTVGPLNDFGASHTTVSMGGNPMGFSYISGGGVVSFASSSDLAMIVHLERWPGGDGAHFYGTIGLCKSTDTGASWTYVGELLTLAYPYDPGATSNLQDIESGSPIAVGSYYYIIYREYTGPVSFSDSYWSVARCLISAFNTAVSGGNVPTFDKWQGGASWGGSNTGAELTTLDGKLHWCDFWQDSATGAYLCLGNYNENYPVGAVYPSVMLSYDAIHWFGLTNIGVALEKASYNSLWPTTISSTKVGAGPWYANYIAGPRWDNCTITQRQFTIGDSGRAVTTAGVLGVV